MRCSRLSGGGGGGGVQLRVSSRGSKKGSHFGHYVPSTYIGG